MFDLKITSKNEKVHLNWRLGIKRWKLWRRVFNIKISNWYFFSYDWEKLLFHGSDVFSQLIEMPRKRKVVIHRETLAKEILFSNSPLFKFFQRKVFVNKKRGEKMNLLDNLRLGWLLPNMFHQRFLDC